MLQTIQYMRLNQKKQLSLPEVTICLQQRAPVTIELRMKIPDGYFVKILSLLKNYYVSCDSADVFHPDFCGDIIVLMTNNSCIPFEIKAGQRIVQIVFHKKEEVVFKKV